MDSNSKRIAKNTSILYLRMIVLMLISLFTARITLNALGIEDYGINNVVGGLVALFSLLSNSMAASSSRFISYALGEGNHKQLNCVFSTTINIHCILTLILIVIIEFIGVWFLNNRMSIAHGRLDAANWVLQCSILNFALGIMFIPYNACIIAHEKMNAFAYMTIIDAIFKLILAFSVLYFRGDKLILYAILGLCFTIIDQTIYRYYCHKHFEECHYRWVWNNSLNKSIFSFSGWNFIGAGSGVLRDQGVNILLNLFCGTAVNAARGIAVQVNSVVNQFVQSFMMALNPQITKSYASHERNYTLKLVFQGSRFSYFLLLLLSLPIMLETKILLNTWLGILPDYTVIFVRLILVYNMVEALSYTMVTLMLSTGNIRNYQIVVGGCQLLNFPLVYLLLRYGYTPIVAYNVAIVIAILCLVLRLIMLHKMVAFPVVSFIKTVIRNILEVTIVATLFPFLLISCMESNWIRLVVTTFTSVISVALSVYYVGCTKEEKNYFIHLVKIKLKYANK